MDPKWGGAYAPGWAYTSSFTVYTQSLNHIWDESAFSFLSSFILFYLVLAIYFLFCKKWYIFLILSTSSDVSTSTRTLTMTFPLSEHMSVAHCLDMGG